MNQQQNQTKVTIDLIAEKSGFSKATVSRVINHEGSVKPATATKIEKVITELGYVPSSFASALSGGKSRTVGVILPDLMTEYYSALLSGIDTVAEEKNYNILLKTHNSRRPLSELALGERVDAFIIRNNGLNPIDHNFLVTLKRKGIPFLFIGKPPEDDGPAILVDTVGGARQMAHHFVQHGFKRILFIAGTEENLDSSDRIYGFKLGLSEKNFEPDLLDIVHGDFSQESGFKIAQEKLQQSSYDAIFCANDYMALGAIMCCRTKGIRVPEDVAVTGFDDTFFAQYLIPSLTTIQQPMFEIGTAAMENIVKLIEGPRLHEQKIILPTQLQVRQSCGCHIFDTEEGSIA
jgi:DNA-binding LacI/PurR family transcriptional regulator